MAKSEHLNFRVGMLFEVVVTGKKKIWLEKERRFSRPRKTKRKETWMVTEVTYGTVFFRNAETNRFGSAFRGELTKEIVEQKLEKGEWKEKKEKKIISPRRRVKKGISYAELYQSLLEENKRLEKRLKKIEKETRRNETI